ncbi:CoA pyrophosphatase [Clostridium sp. MSJ-11]|uniref:CoA pyrophosphatase n=1 Tax=Clostridium mobile TaxID=2841512 RepID=A0ABS6EIA0_9CLOT|nr:CoA pyrophosphatase [Clostridium mobile]MBU5484872.1 CoA pyrophosphatase [Clostridium mobile]
MLNNIMSIFAKRNKGIIGNYEKSSVIIFLISDNENLEVLFQVRAFNLQHQPGDISLPGGRIENGETEEEAAIRESIEELNIKREDFKIIGEMDSLVTHYNRIIYPFVALLNKNQIDPSEDEVDHVFKVPLKYFLENEPEVYEIKIMPQVPENFPYHLIVGGKDYKFSKSNIEQYFYQYNGYVIWGMTAQIIKSFVDIIRSEGLKEDNEK